MMENVREGIPFQVCPHRECENPMMEWVTNVHCETVHGMTKKEVIEKYGPINEIIVKNG